MVRTATALAGCLFVGTSFAGTITPGSTQITMTGTDGTSDWMLTPTTNYDASGDFSWQTADQDAGTFSVNNLQISGNVDPVISVSFDLTNNTAFDQSYVFTFTLPVPAVGPATLNGGSTSISTTDTNGGGVTVSTPTGVFYTALIDGVAYETIDLLNPDLVAGEFLSTGASDAFGQPIPSQVGPPVATSIGLQYELTLTAGDSVGITGVYVVEQVPEPGSLALLGVAGLMGARRRRG